MPSLVKLTRDKAKLKSGLKKSNAFLKEVRKAKKSGAKNAKVGSKTHSITSLISKGMKVKKATATKLKRINISIAINKKKAGK